jgi:hypothetical protein
MKIDPSETVLAGNWVDDHGRVIADQTCERINALIQTHLEELGRNPSGWDALYRDPDNGRLWELAYPQSELHGGGPPRLRALTIDEAKQKYGDVVGNS